jgi:uncharacterized protein
VILVVLINGGESAAEGLIGARRGTTNGHRWSDWRSTEPDRQGHAADRQRPEKRVPSNSLRRCSMPVSHDLCQDLKCTEEDILKKRREDESLDALIKKYAKLDAEVVKAEKPPAVLSDAALETLKKERLQVKDQIAALMQN